MQASREGSVPLRGRGCPCPGTRRIAWGAADSAGLVSGTQRGRQGGPVPLQAVRVQFRRRHGQGHARAGAAAPAAVQGMRGWGGGLIGQASCNPPSAPSRSTGPMGLSPAFPLPGDPRKPSCSCASHGVSALYPLVAGGVPECTEQAHRCCLLAPDSPCLCSLLGAQPACSSEGLRGSRGPGGHVPGATAAAGVLGCPGEHPPGAGQPRSPGDGC